MTSCSSWRVDEWRVEILKNAMTTWRVTSRNSEKRMTSWRMTRRFWTYYVMGKVDNLWLELPWKKFIFFNSRKGTDGKETGMITCSCMGDEEQDGNPYIRWVIFFDTFSTKNSYRVSRCFKSKFSCIDKQRMINHLIKHHTPKGKKRRASQPDPNQEQNYNLQK